jgi:diguanylate cyclase (GGDEF)-like protein
MKPHNQTGIETAPAGPNRSLLLACAIGGMLAIVGTYIVASSSFTASAKTQGFAAILAAFLTVTVLLFIRPSRTTRFRSRDPQKNLQDTLCSLDEASEVFLGSIKLPDATEIVIEKIGELLPVRGADLLLLDAEQSRFNVRVARNSPGLVGGSVALYEGPVGRCYATAKVVVDRPSSVAVLPLSKGTYMFGALRLYLEPTHLPKDEMIESLPAVGQRVSAMIQACIEAERTISNALTDATTDLPNERAFYLILENQLAECQRKLDRPLTVLAIDIKSFDEMNQRFGHASGDRILNFAANLIKDSLRQMDFFARSTADEFLIVLPTASKEISHDIITRIQTSFFGNKLKISDSNSVEIGLNFGWSAFGTDGEDADLLLKTARLRKSESKSPSSKVLWFPSELVS